MSKLDIENAVVSTIYQQDITGLTTIQVFPCFYSRLIQIVGNIPGKINDLKLESYNRLSFIASNQKLSLVINPGSFSYVIYVIHPEYASAFIDKDALVEPDKIIALDTEQFWKENPDPYLEYKELNKQVLERGQFRILDYLNDSRENWQDDDFFITSAALKLIKKDTGRINVTELCKLLDTPYNRVNKALKKKLGMSPNQTLRLYRIQKVFELIHKGKNRYDIAYDLGFFDVPHLEKEIRFFTKENISSLIQNISKQNNGMSTDEQEIIFFQSTDSVIPSSIINT